MNRQNNKYIWLDPRTKLFLLIICVVTSMLAPNLKCVFFLVIAISVLACMEGQWKYAIKSLILYSCIYLFTLWAMMEVEENLRTSFIAFLGLFHKVYPCGYLSGLIITTTKVNEFLSAMQKLHIPKHIVIPIAVMLRYLPTIREDWSYIKDAMKMRDVAPNLKNLFMNPLMCIECIYTPLMMTASKTADELTIASITRGIENPKKRSCVTIIKFGAYDAVLVFAAISFLAYVFLLRGGMVS